MFKKIFILINLGSNNILHSTNTIALAILMYKKLIISIFLKKNNHYINLKNNLC
tara:strand:- start:462 stop:623 length:162 start_codon:yes stop_codon:yes gene_type:complete